MNEVIIKTVYRAGLGLIVISKSYPHPATVGGKHVRLIYIGHAGQVSITFADLDEMRRTILDLGALSVVVEAQPMTRDEAHGIVAAGMRNAVSEERFREALEVLDRNPTLVHAFEPVSFSSIGGEKK